MFDEYYSNIKHRVKKIINESKFLIMSVDSSSDRFRDDITHVILFNHDGKPLLWKQFSFYGGKKGKIPTL